MILLLHAFSRANAGDGLLVDLTLEALTDAGIAPDECVLLALDSESFSDLPNVLRAPGEPTARPSWQLARAACELVAGRAGRGEIFRRVREARAMVAVGGGYLVADSPIRRAGVLLNHLTQLRAAAHSQRPTIYLPQSIGPLTGLTGRLTKQALAGIDRVYLRDDRSISELSLDNAVRCPDLAVMKLARSLAPGPKRPGGSVVIVGRDLPKANGYVERLSKLHALVAKPVWAVQADIPGPRSDRAFYRSAGLRDDGPLSRVLEETEVAAVVSVRLHGAIAALLAGRPAIHLAYERKGWGAYEDLGLAEFVHDARSFSPELVAKQSMELANDPAPFWGRVEMARSKITSAYEIMVKDLRSRLTINSDRQ